MAKRGGFGGAMPGGMNINNLMKQAQKMQEDMMKAKADLEEKVFETSVGGGAVVLKMNGAKQLLEVNIKPEVLDPEDVEMLEDMILSAVNQAINQVEEASQSELGKLTGGMGLPF